MFLRNLFLQPTILLKISSEIFQGLYKIFQNKQQYPHK